MSEPIEWNTCPQCSGSGRTGFMPVCPGCRGKGRVPSVTHPPERSNLESDTDLTINALNAALAQAQIERAALQNALEQLSKQLGVADAENIELRQALHHACELAMRPEGELTPADGEWLHNARHL